MPRLESSELQPEVRLVTTFEIDWLVQDPEEQMPVSQVLTVDGIDPELLPTTKDSIAEGFKQAASEDHSMLKDPPAHITEFSYRVMSTIPRASSGILDLE